MALTVITTDINTNVANGFTLAADDSVYLPQGVSVYATGATFSGIAGSSGSIDVLGAILGNVAGIKLQGSGTGQGNVFVAKTGSVIGLDGLFASELDSLKVVNLGLIKGTDAANIGGIGDVVIDNSGTMVGDIRSGVVGPPPGNATFTLLNRAGGLLDGNYEAFPDFSVATETILNDGTITGKVTLGSGIGSIVANHGSMTDVDFGSSISASLANFGVMGGLDMGSGAGNKALNAGQILGVVRLGNGRGQFFDSTQGTVLNQLGQNFNVIRGGSGGDTIIGALNGSTILGGSGNDVLMANQTWQSADQYDATTILNGGSGTNALYGGHGHNVFLAGTSDGGFNQIWGGLNGWGDYSHNLLSFAQADAGVYVDLAGGHNAYIGDTEGEGWQGTGTLEDSIANVPNVTGSKFDDIIVAGQDCGVITGGEGADQLYTSSAFGLTSGQDTFVYTQYSDSNLVSGYDLILGFEIGTDKIDLSAFHLSSANLVIDTSGTQNSVYLETTPGTFNQNTDLAIAVTANTTDGLKSSDFIF
jgi:hypothetical protein